jgi:TonB-linked SusC/RagA family outer membrane protein
MAGKALLLCLGLILISEMAFAGQATASVFNSSSNKQERNVSVVFEDEPLGDALHALARKVKVGISYNTKTMPDKLITYRAQNVSVYKVLDGILIGTGLQATLSIDRKVILIKKNSVLPRVRQETITGTVTDADNGQDLPGVNILVKGTTTGTSTDTNGSFELTLESLQDTLVVSFVGYQRQEVPVNGRSTVDIVMQTQTISGEELVVTGVATSTARKNLANAVESINAEALDIAPAQSIEQKLQGKIAGANIQQNSGAPGGGIQVNLRGVSSINADAQPLYVIDGIILSNESISGRIGGITANSADDTDEDNSVNRIADINPDDIKNIEVLKGASASAIYGSRASNGVIIITTKGGTEGETEINFSQKLGFYDLSNTIGSRTFETEEEAVSAFGPTAAEFFGAGQTFKNEEALADRNDVSLETTLSLSGGNESTQYFISGLIKDDKGIIENTGYQKQSFRANLTQEISSKIDLRFTSNLIHSRSGRGLTNNDNTGGTSFYVAFSGTPNFIDLRKQGTLFPVNPFVSSNPLQTAALLKNDEDVWRFISSAKLTYDVVNTPSSNLIFTGDLGVDRFQQLNNLLSPPELQYENNDGLPGTLLKTNSSNLNINSSLNLVHSFTPKSADLQLTSSIGAQYQSRDLETARTTSQNLIAGQTQSDAATVIGVFDNRSKVVDLGLYVQEELSLLNERLFITLATRADRSSNAGNTEKFFLYPKASVSYRFEQLVPGFVDELKLRTALGFSGNQPLYGQKFTPLSGNSTISGNAGLTVTGIAGDSDIEPERQREIEGGFDAQLFNDKANLNFTIYQQNITNLLLERQLTPSVGFQSRFFNGGELQVQGIEVGLQLTPVSNNSVNWNVNTTFYKNSSEIVGLPVPGFQAGGFGASLGGFRVEEGKSATEIYANQGGELTALGNSNPDFTINLTNNISWKQFGFNFLWNWQQGSEIINLTKLLYDLSANSKDWDSAGADRVADFGVNTKPYIEDATYLKLREVSLSYRVNSDFLKQIWSGFRDMTFKLSGRDLLTFTGYSGLDPEVSNFGNQQIGRNVDVAPFPPSRSYWFSIDLGL